MKGLIEGKSDPYALVRVGTQAFCSRVIDEDLNPQWGETYEVGELRSGTVKWGEALGAVRRCQLDDPHRVAGETLVPVLQVMVHEVPGQEIEVEVFDKDPDKDDFLGR